MDQSLRGAWHLTVMEFRLFFREPAAAFFTLILPLMFLILFGTIYGNEPTPFLGNFGYVDISVPSYGALIIATAGLMNIPILIASYREKRILWRFRATPVHPLAILAAELTVALAMSFLGMLILVVFGKLLYHLQFVGNVFWVVLAYAICSIVFLALGFALACLAPTARTAQVVGMVLFFPMLFLTGASIPREVLGPKIMAFGKYLPLSPVVTILRGLWTGASPGQFLKEWAYLLVLFVAGIGFSAKYFRWE